MAVRTAEFIIRKVPRAIVNFVIKSIDVRLVADPNLELPELILLSASSSEDCSSTTTTSSAQAKIWKTNKIRRLPLIEIH
jgi:hypothetical protein